MRLLEKESERLIISLTGVVQRFVPVEEIVEVDLSLQLSGLVRKEDQRYENGNRTRHLRDVIDHFCRP
jgi:hypothetical protein